MSLASVDREYAETGTELIVWWGEEPTPQPQVEPHQQFGNSRHLAFVPYSQFARTTTGKQLAGRRKNLRNVFPKRDPLARPPGTWARRRCIDLLVVPQEASNSRRLQQAKRVSAGGLVVHIEGIVARRAALARGRRGSPSDESPPQAAQTPPGLPVGSRTSDAGCHSFAHPRWPSAPSSTTCGAQP